MYKERGLGLGQSFEIEPIAYIATGISRDLAGDAFID